MSAWTLVEAEVGATAGGQQQANNEKVRSTSNANNNSSRSRGRGGSRANAPRNKNLGLYAVQQINLLLSAENLCMDTYIRPNMDECGYIPIAYICNFPNVASIGATYEEILKAMEAQCKFDTFKLELDGENETIRVKENWKMWLVPNRETGKLGLDRYVKLTQEQEEKDQKQTQTQTQESEQVQVQGEAKASQLA